MADMTDPRKQALLRWFCTPAKEREPRTYTLLAEQLGVDRRTLQNWRDDRDFLQAWEKHYLRTIGDPARKSQIMETLLKTATDPDDPKHVQAAKAYFEIEGSMKPSRVSVELNQRPAKELTDAELAELVQLHAVAERQQRDEAS